MNRFSLVCGLLLNFYQVFAQESLIQVSPYYQAEFGTHTSELLISFSPPKTENSIPSQKEEPWKKWNTVDNYTFGKDRGSLPMIADINALHPYFREKVNTLIANCAAKGIELAVVETFRTHTKQNEYRAMGKNYTRSKGGHSKHQYGLAIDVVPIVNGEPQWNNGKLWRKIGLIGEQLGLHWGGRWKSLYDPGHFEWTGGLSTYHLANGMFPKVPKPEKYPCLQEELLILTQAWKAWETEQSILTRKTENSVSGMK